MTELTYAYAEGRDAYANSLDAGDNPYYTSFGDLTPEFHEWLNGWEDAHEDWYAWVDESESDEWRNYLNEESDD